jgi:hypothetical protein
VETDLERKLVDLFFGKLDGAALQDDDAHGFLVRLLFEVEEQVPLEHEVPFLEGLVHLPAFPEPAFFLPLRKKYKFKLK